MQKMQKYLGKNLNPIYKVLKKGSVCVCVFIIWSYHMGLISVALYLDS